MTDHVVDADRDLGLQGHYAGMVTRFAAFVIDLATAATLFVLGACVVEFIVSALIGKEAKLSNAPILSMIASGRMVVPLLRVCPERGRPHLRHGGARPAGGPGRRERARRWHTVLRVLIFPLSFLLFGLGFLLILIRKDRRALHDLLGRARASSTPGTLAPPACGSSPGARPQ